MHDSLEQQAEARVKAGPFPSPSRKPAHPPGFELERKGEGGGAISLTLFYVPFT